MRSNELCDLGRAPDTLSAYEVLFHVLDGHGDLPAGTDLVEAIRRLPDRGYLPPVSCTWSLMQLTADRPRQAWAATALVPPILAEAAVQAALAANQLIIGRVPGRCDWRFKVDRCKTKVKWSFELRATGEVVNFETRFVDVHRDVAVPECTSRSLMAYALDRCGGWGGQDVREDRAISRWLAKRLPRYEPAIRAFSEAWPDMGGRRWLAALIGDWPAAHAAALLSRDEKLSTEARRRAAAQLTDNPSEVRAFLTDGVLQPSRRWALRTLAEHHVAYVEEALKAFLNAGPDSLTALRAVVELDLPGWEEQVLHRCGSEFELLLPDWEDEVPHWCRSPHVPVNEYIEARAAAYLARRGVLTEQVVSDMVRRTCPASDPSWDLPALVAARYVPDLAEQVFRDGLSAEDEETRLRVAAGLTVVNRPWADSLLAEAVSRCEFARMAAARRRDPAPPAACPAGPADSGATPGTQLLSIDRGNGFRPRYYLGRIEDLFEDEVELVTRLAATI